MAIHFDYGAAVGVRRFADDLEALELKTENWIITFGLILLQNVMILNSVGVKER